MWQAEGEEVIPLGLIDSDWGGTPIEAWSTTESLASCDAPITESCNRLTQTALTTTELPWTVTDCSTLPLTVTDCKRIYTNNGQNLP